MNLSIAKRKRVDNFKSSIKKNRQKRYANRRIMQSSQMAARRLRYELKFVDLPYTSSNIPAAASPMLVLLNGIAPGSANWNRIGNKVNLKSIRIRGSINFATTAANIPNQDIRMLIVYDKNPNKSNPTLSDILQQTTQTGATSQNVFSNPNINNRERFKILRDRTWNTPYYTFTSNILTNCETTDIDYRIDEYIKLKNLPTIYSGTSTTCTIGDITSGALFMIFYETTASQFAVGYETRLRFDDV